MPDFLPGAHVIASANAHRWHTSLVLSEPASAERIEGEIPAAEGGFLLVIIVLAGSSSRRSSLRFPKSAACIGLLTSVGMPRCDCIAYICV